MQHSPVHQYNDQYDQYIHPYSVQENEMLERNFAFGPLGAGLVGFGLGYLGGELFGNPAIGYPRPGPYGYPGGPWFGGYGYPGAGRPPYYGRPPYFGYPRY
ncbi:hypothetical protein [Sediminibacillus halophilus]|uniref:Uncharacterized protein n=1 Tax=Sediminibacillus halophilus TaxID=482461 RepID=A0A1G9M6A1_9BACI|nr:hypothetical protein [Sediminibacillus halophilus]SDL69215.1 hypothetical protein SAMN05216244_0421 [Sediminibacillus halophilus]